MNTKLISDKAHTLIDQYKHFRLNADVQTSSCSIPYFNNRRTGVRGVLRALNGKGSPKDIFDEAEIAALKEKLNPKVLTGDTLKRFLIDHSIGIDCSGFAYYVLNAESIARKKGALDRHLSFPYAKGLIGKFRAKLRPAENTNVITLAHNKNSRVVPLTEVMPGDMITMVSTTEHARDHILIIHQVEYQNLVPTTIHYTHSIAWPTDGTYGHGIHEGKIEIIDVNKPLTEQRWVENEKIGGNTSNTESSTPTENYTFSRARECTTELRRLAYFD